MKPPARSLSVAEGPPIVGKRIKEGLVSQIASKFQRQESGADSAPAPRRPERISLDLPSPTSPQRFSSESRKDEDRARVVARRAVTRTESHHTRFNNARALFEKLGSAEELDSPTCPAAAAAVAAVGPLSTASASGRAASVGRPSSRSSDEGGAQQKHARAAAAAATAAATSSTSTSSTSAYYRSRSSSPFSGGNRSTSVPAERPSRTSLTNGHTADGAAGDHAAAASSVNNGTSETMGIVKTRRLSFQQKQQQQQQAASSSGSSPTPNGLPPAHESKSTTVERGRQQRNWFPTGSTRQQESVESARRTSVKNDSTPNLVSSPKVAAAAATSSSPDSSPVPPSNLDLPGDRRPLASATSDSIEEYIKNWKKDSPDEATKEAPGSSSCTSSSQEKSSQPATPTSSRPPFTADSLASGSRVSSFRSKFEGKEFIFPFNLRLPPSERLFFFFF